MRRGLASLIIGLSLLVATVSWAGFTLSRTILDPGRSERLAEQLLENPQVREALVDRLSDAVEPQIPPEVPVSRGLIEAGAETALDDPRVKALIVDGVVQYHRNALEGNPEPVVIDAAALGSASRDSLVAVRPELDQFLPPVPVIQLELPTTGFTWLATLKRFVDRFTLLGALVALAGGTLALLVAQDRGAVLRRVAFWGYGAAAFWIVVGFAVPRLADLLSPTSGAIASAAVDVFFGAMIRPAVTLAVVSTVVLLIGFLLPAISGRRGARMIQPRGGQAGPPPVAALGPIAKPATRPAPAPAPIAPPSAPRAPSGATAAMPTQAGGIRTTPDPTMVAPRPGAPTPTTRIDNTAEMPRPTMTTATTTATTAAAGGPEPLDHVSPVGPASTPTTGSADAAETLEALETPPEWEEGVGYVDEAEPKPFS